MYVRKSLYIYLRTWNSAEIIRDVYLRLLSCEIGDDIIDT